MANRHQPREPGDAMIVGSVNQGTTTFSHGLRRATTSIFVTLFVIRHVFVVFDALRVGGNHFPTGAINGEVLHGPLHYAPDQMIWISLGDELLRGEYSTQLATIMDVVRTRFVVAHAVLGGLTTICLRLGIPRKVGRLDHSD